MWNIEDIHQLQIEITSVCSAGCPGCARLKLKKFNHMNQNIWQQIVQPINLKHIKKINFNGNFGDFIYHPTSVDFLDLLPRSLEIEISTNGSIRNEEYWIKLANTLKEFKNHLVNFAIDGVTNETHSRHRINTDLDQILTNAQTFIKSGGFAGWKMITFNENKHQIFQARKLSLAYKFKRFKILNSYSKKLSNGLTALNFNEYSFFSKLNFYLTPFEKVLENSDHNDCIWKHWRMVQILSDGSVWPCCFMSSDDVHQLPFVENKDIPTLGKYNLKEIFDSELFQNSFSKEIKKIGDSFCNKRCPARVEDHTYNKYYNNNSIILKKL